MPGSPCIYYGTEIALEGAHDPDCRRCMPWDEIDSAENQKKIELMKSLIRMRIQEDACRSLYFDFPHKYSQKRCVEYRKLNLDGKWIEVLLNCGSEPIEIQGQGEILFARRCEGNSLDVRGTLTGGCHLRCDEDSAFHPHHHRACRWRWGCCVPVLSRPGRRRTVVWWMLPRWLGWC